MEVQVSTCLHIKIETPCMYIYIYMCVSFSMFDSGVVAVVGLL